jgi:hypothetical protein
MRKKGVKVSLLAFEGFTNTSFVPKPLVGCGEARTASIRSA